MALLATINGKAGSGIKEKKGANHATTD